MQDQTGAQTGEGLSLIERARQLAPWNIPELTGPEAVVLIALVQVGIDAYRDGKTGRAASVLDKMPRDAFDGLAAKLETVI